MGALKEAVRRDSLEFCFSRPEGKGEGADGNSQGKGGPGAPGEIQKIDVKGIKRAQCRKGKEKKVKEKIGNESIGYEMK